MDQEQATEIKFFDASSRIGRVRYMAYPWGTVLLILPAAILVGILAAFELGFLAISIGILAEIFILVMSGVFMVRRLHDFNRSGWWSLIYWGLTVWNFWSTMQAFMANPMSPRPFNGLFTLAALVLFLILLLTPGTNGPNRFGPVPPPNSTWALVGAWAWLLLPVLGIFAAIAIPAYQDYIARAQTSEAIQLASGAEQSLASYHDQYKVWPTDLSSLYPKGLDGSIGRYSQGLTAITVSDGSMFGIMVTMKKTGVAPRIAGKSMEVWTSDGHTWHCGPSSMDSIEPRYLPTTCRETGAP